MTAPWKPDPLAHCMYDTGPSRRLRWLNRVSAAVIAVVFWFLFVEPFVAWVKAH